jgi:hypothetical protein
MVRLSKHNIYYVAIFCQNGIHNYLNPSVLLSNQLFGCGMGKMKAVKSKSWLLFSIFYSITLLSALSIKKPGFLYQFSKSMQQYM